MYPPENRNKPRPKGYDAEKNYRMYADMYIQANKDKDFVQRIIDPFSIPSLDRGNGSESTHSMRAEVDDRTGKWHVFPEVVNENGTLVDKGKDKAFTYALDNGETMEISDPQLAIWMANQGYKKTESAAGQFDPPKHRGYQEGGPVRSYGNIGSINDPFPVSKMEGVDKAVNLIELAKETGLMKQLRKNEEMRDFLAKDSNIAGQAMAKFRTGVNLPNPFAPFGGGSPWITGNILQMAVDKKKEPMRAQEARKKVKHF